MNLTYSYLILLFAFFGLNIQAETIYSGCAEYGTEVEIKFSNAFILNKNFIEDLSDANLIEAARQQIRFARGELINNRKTNMYSVTLDVENAKISIIAKSEIKYNKKLILDKIDHPNVTIDSPYIINALKVGKTNLKDKAISVTYQATAKAHYCGSKEYVSKITFKLPKDPYLAYWFVKEKDRHEIVWRNSKFKINPCADSELVDTPHPYYFWYFWEPSKIGKDTRNLSFNCNTLLKQVIDYSKVYPSISEVKMQLDLNNNFSKILSDSDSKTVSVIFGVIDEHDHILNWEKILYSKENLKSISALNHAIYKDLNQTQVDRGSQYFSNFLTHLSQVAKIDSIKLGNNKKELVFNISLNKTLKKLDLHIWFGLTDVLGTKPAQHWSYTRWSLENANVILYNGHSGLGQNMKIENILQNEDKIISISKIPKSQFIGYFSCYSFGYFGDDLADLRKTIDPLSKTEIMLTATEFTSERGPLGILVHMDSKENLSFSDLKWLKLEDQLVVKLKN